MSLNYPAYLLFIVFLARISAIDGRNSPTVDTTTRTENHAPSRQEPTKHPNRISNVKGDAQHTAPNHEERAGSLLGNVPGESFDLSALHHEEAAQYTQNTGTTHNIERNRGEDTGNGSQPLSGSKAAGNGRDVNGTGGDRSSGEEMGGGEERGGPLVISMPITILTVSMFLIVLGFAALGGVYFHKLMKQHKCSCPLCKGEYSIEERIGKGGFGEVFAVRAKQTKESALLAMRKTGAGLIRWLATPFAKATTNGEAGSQTAAGSPNELKESSTPEEGGRSPPAPGTPAGEPALEPKGRPRVASSDTSSGGSDVDVLLEKKAAAAPTPLAVVSGLTYVLKMVPVTDINDATEAQREARDLRYLKHPRIVRYVDDFLHSTPSGATKDGSLYVCIVMERCKYDMRQFIEKWRKKSHPIPEHAIVRWAAQLISALKYCHARGVCHRDVKSQNIFLSSPLGAGPQLEAIAKQDPCFDDVKLGDFGLARTFERPVTAYTEAGTDVYKSPEAFMGGKRDGRKADIWALGLVLTELMTKQFTWQRPGSLGAQVLKKEGGALEKVLALLPASYTPSLRQIVKKCLLPNPDDRPTAAELFRFKILRRALASKVSANHSMYLGGDASVQAAAIESARGTAGHHMRHTKSDIHSLIRRTNFHAELNGKGGAAATATQAATTVFGAAPKVKFSKDAKVGSARQTPEKANKFGTNTNQPLPAQARPDAAGLATSAHPVPHATPMSVRSSTSDRAVTDLDLLSDGPAGVPKFPRLGSDGGADADAESDAMSPGWQQVQHRRQVRKRRTKGT